MLVLDTHAIVYWSCIPKMLSPKAAHALEEAEVIGLPCIAFWETALLMRKRRLELGMTVGEWAKHLLAIPRCRALPLSSEIAILADSLEMHADPADRFIVATALNSGAPLLTKDEFIRGARLVETIW